MLYHEEKKHICCTIYAIICTYIKSCKPTVKNTQNKMPVQSSGNEQHKERFKELRLDIPVFEMCNEEGNLEN